MCLLIDGPARVPCSKVRFESGLRGGRSTACALSVRVRARRGGPVGMGACLRTPGNDVTSASRGVFIPSTSSLYFLSKDVEGPLL